jgi:hypothetical protein
MCYRPIPWFTSKLANSKMSSLGFDAHEGRHDAFFQTNPFRAREEHQGRLWCWFHEAPSVAIARVTCPCPFARDRISVDTTPLKMAATESTSFVWLWLATLQERSRMALALQKHRKTMIEGEIWPKWFCLNIQWRTIWLFFALRPLKNIFRVQTLIPTFKRYINWHTICHKLFLRNPLIQLFPYCDTIEPHVSSLRNVQCSGVIRC